MSDLNKSVVVVGGGHAGTAIARRLSTKLDKSSHSLTLISPRPFLVFRPALVRITVTGDQDLASQALMPYDHLFANGNGKVVIGTVEKVEDQKEGGNVVLTNGEKVFYNVLVLATGSNWNIVDTPNTQKEVSEWINENSSNISDANRIVLVGGGAIGVEFSGEIKDIYPVRQSIQKSLDLNLIDPCVQHCVGEKGYDCPW
jgi:NADH dehydrogenase FAD-containing subunit